MGEIAVFVPGNCERHPNYLVGIGLGALLDDRVTVSTIDGPNGPEGKHGVTFNFSHDGEADYRSERIGPQSHWLPLAKDGEQESRRAFLGWNAGSPPAPKDLLRKDWKDGEPLALADGRHWLIPIARQLPQVISLGEDGSLVTQPVERYRKFFRDACMALQWFDSDGEGKARVQYREGFQFAVDAIAVNYRMTPDLASGLGLISTEHLWGIPKIVCEWDALAAMAAQIANQDQKKNLTSEEQPIAAGEPG